jgi:uncharacterized SAM-binding protein YcdF (DUF218 family)
MRHGLHRLLGADGYLTLAVSNLVIIATCGLSWLWQVARVHRVASLAPANRAKVEVAVVLGFRLHENHVCPEFAMRLDRARSLYVRGIARRILVVGGRMGHSRLSEAEAGRLYLAARGIPDEAILREEYSRHTLENLRYARAAIEGCGERGFLLITSRYHLARSAALAQGLGLRPTLCPAEDRLGLDILTFLRLCREAWFLHWYVVGRAWARLTGDHRSLARIS